MIFANVSLAFAYALAVSPLTAYAASQRRLVNPNQSIADVVAAAHSKGKGPNGNGNSNGRAKFKLQGELPNGGNFEINVKECTPAITSLTTTSKDGGPNVSVKTNDLATILVADPDEEEESGAIAIIAVDGKTDKVNGIVHRGGMKMKFTQEKGKKVRIWAFLY